MADEVKKTGLLAQLQEKKEATQAAAATDNAALSTELSADANPEEDPGKLAATRPIETSQLFFPDPEPDQATILVRHKTVRRFKIGKFIFKHNLLRINGQDDIDQFMGLAGKLPERERIQLVKIDEEARARAEQPLAGGGTVRGALQATDILTAKDKNRIAEAKAAKSADK